MNDLIKNELILDNENYILNIITFATDINRIKYLKETEKIFNTKINYIIKDKWNGFHDKIIETKKIISKLNDNELVLFIDAYDVLLNSDYEEIIKKFKNLNCDILLSAELNCHPRFLKKNYIKICSANMLKVKNKYINSGGYMGYVKHIKKFYSWKSEDEIMNICINGGDQTYFIKYYIENYNKVNIILDIRSQIFQNMYLILWKEFDFRNGRLYNNIFNNRPCFIHFNGTTYRTNDNKNIMPVFIEKMNLSNKNNKNIYTLKEYRQMTSKHFIPCSQI